MIAVSRVLHALALLLIGAAAAAILWRWSDAARIDGAWIPLENDSFYHAHRIIDAAKGGLPEFDARIHVPEGSQITWPWAYDAALGQLLRIAQHLETSLAPMDVLAWWGPLLLLVNLFLVHAISRQLQLRPGLRLFAIAVVALCPQVLFRHAFGMIDHHGAELTAMLLALWSGMRWQLLPTRFNAALHGVLLALVLGIHNGLFLLQAFTLTALAWQWIRRDTPFAPTLIPFAMALVAGTLLVLAPSTPFLQGMTAYYLLSWFHLLAAVLTAGAAILMSRLAPRAPGIAILVLYSAAAATALLSLARGSAAYVSGEMTDLQTIGETISAWESISSLGWREFVSYNTLPALVAPLSLIALWWAGWLGGLRPWLASYALFGIVLFALQSRFWTYGLVPAVLCAAVAIETALRRAPQPKAQEAAALVLASILSLALVPASLAAPPIGGSHWYAPFQSVQIPLERACVSEEPPVLANPNLGHFITYHTRCGVIANNFILTPQHLEKRAEVRRLFDRAPADYLQLSDAPRLILVDTSPALLRHFARTGSDPRTHEPRRLARELGGPLPPGFELVAESRLARGTMEIPVARLIRVAPPQEQGIERAAP
jgi:asparagine N-glycosylation enzyme membrane subunit Stt3